MTTPPLLFDHSALALRRARSTMDAFFIHEQAIEVIHERLSEVNRTFKNVAIIGFRAKEWAKSLDIEATCFLDRENLSLSENEFDLVINALTLHWANDPVGQLVQMRRALKPDGLMISAFFGGQTLAELRVTFAESESEILGGISPRIAPMGEIRDLGALLQRSGFALPVADSISLNVSYSSPVALMHDLRAMGETNVLTTRFKSPISKRLLNCLTTRYIKHFSEDGDRVSATFDLIFLTGWAPSDDQQKPQKPGSAKMRLSEALGVPEKSP